MLMKKQPTGRKPRLSTEDKENVTQWLLDGYTIGSIANELKCSRSVIELYIASNKRVNNV